MIHVCLSLPVGGCVTVSVSVLVCLRVFESVTEFLCLWMFVFLYVFLCMCVSDSVQTANTTTPGTGNHHIGVK